MEDLSPRLARGATMCVKNCLRYNGYFHQTVGSQFHGVAKGTINIFLFRRGCFLGFDLGAFAKSGPYPARTDNSNDNNGPNPPSTWALNPFFRLCRPQAIFFQISIWKKNAPLSKKNAPLIQISVFHQKTHCQKWHPLWGGVVIYNCPVVKRMHIRNIDSLTNSHPVPFSFLITTFDLGGVWRCSYV